MTSMAVSARFGLPSSSRFPRPDSAASWGGMAGSRQLHSARHFSVPSWLRLSRLLGVVYALPSSCRQVSCGICATAAGSLRLAPARVKALRPESAVNWHFSYVRSAVQNQGLGLCELAELRCPRWLR